MLLALLLGVRAALGANSPPVANPDSYAVNEDTTLSISSPGVLGNDTDAEGNSLSTVLVSNVTRGTLTLNSGGSFTYRPSTNYNGSDSFIYRARDSSGTSAPVAVSITINPTNDLPRATNDIYSANSDTTLSILVPGVLGNDFDPDGDELRAILSTNVTRGTLALSTNGSFTYTPVGGYAGNDSFAYRVSDGRATSAVAIATINVMPAPIVVTTPPVNQTNCVGSTAIFSVTATGTALRYQWLKGTTTLTGQTNSTLQLPNLTTGDAGTYRVRLTGATNSITNSATLTVNTPVSAMPMTNLLRFVGSIAIFNSPATGSGPITYSWLRNDVVIPGQTSSSLVLSNLVTADSGTYAVVASGACGSVTNRAELTVADCFPSVDVMLVIDRSASMLGQPYNDARTACTNFVRNLKYGPTNDMAGFVIYNPTSQLRQPLTNNLAVLEQTVANFPAASGGTCISCGLTNAQAALYSSRHRSNALPVMVLMSDGLPKVEDGDSPSNVLYYAQQAKNAGTRIFTVGLGAVDFSLMAAAASSTNDFFYTTNSSQLSALFDTISSIICRPPTNILGPVDATVCAGENVSFNVTASGCDDAFTFQWRKNGVPLAGQTNNTLTLNNAVATNAGIYSVLVSAPCRTVVNSATLTVNTPAEIVVGPANLTGFVGSNVTFSATATGTGLSHAWYREGTLLGTSSTLPLSNLTTNDAGIYCVVVTGSACGGPVTNCATLSIQNRAPAAVNDAYSINEDTTLNITAPGVLANDSDLDGDVLQAVLVSSPAHGTLALGADGGFVYTPNLNFNGADSFTYQASDGTASSPVATVNITVLPVNDIPAANDDAYTMTAGTTLNISLPGVLANDTDIEGSALSAVLESNPIHGTLALNADGSFTYSPDANYSGSDSFTYRAGDGSATSGVATVAVTINPVPLVIVVPPPTGRTNCPGDATTFSVVATGTALTYQWLFGNEILVGATNNSFTLQNLNATNAGDYCVVVGGASGGPITNCAVLVVNENVIVTVPPADLTLCENALAQFTVSATGTALSYQWYFGGAALSNETANTLTLSNVSLSAAGVYTVVVSGACGTPVTNSAALTVDQNLQVLSAPTSQTSFVGSNVTFSIGAIGTGLRYEWFFNGAVISTSNTLELVNLATNQAGIYCVEASGVCGAPMTNCVTLTIQNRPPVASDDSYAIAEDSTLTISAPGILANDSDIDGDALSAVLVSDVSHGTLSLNSNGAFTYTPSLNYTGIDSFTYRASDTRLNSGIATVTIIMAPLNDTPVANDDSYAISEDATLTIPSLGVLANDVDVDGDVLRPVLVSSVTHGTLSLSNNGAFVYTPSLNYTGVDVFTYRATDNVATSAIATVTITIGAFNDIPVANNDAYAILEDEPLMVGIPGILSNDFDPDGNPLTVLLVGDVAHGTLSLSNNGAFFYQPSLNYTGADAFTYRITDGSLTSSVATVTILITPLNDQPVAVNDDFYTTAEDTTLTVAAPGVLTNDIDVDGNPLSSLLVSGVSHGTLNLSNNGAFVYTPSLNYTGLDSFTYQSTDGVLTSGVATVTIMVTPVNDAPVSVADDLYTTLEDTTLTVPALGVLANDIDTDGDALSALLITDVLHGTLSLNSSGAFTYTPSLNYTGVDTFTYVATDGSLTSGVATVTITVLPVNDPPTTGVLGDAYSTLEDQTLTIDAPGLLANDGDVDGNPLAAVLEIGVAHGTLTLNANGSFTYTPAANYFGPDSFTYRASDGQTSSAPATVSITVVSVNDAPSFTAGSEQKVNQNSPMQTVAWASNISAGPTNESSQTTSFQVLNDNPALFALAPEIASDGTLRYTPAANAFGVANVRVVLRDDGGTANGGVDTSAEVVFRIAVNGPPTVSIVSPADGVGLLFPATFSVIASANDPDGTVTNVQFLLNNTNFVRLSAPPFFFVFSNAAPGHYQFRAIATDDFGSSATSSVVNVEVITNAVVATGPIVLNHQNGLFEQFVTVSNRTSETWANGVRLFIRNMDSTNQLFNATGTNGGIPYIDKLVPVPAGQSTAILVQYYVPNPRSIPSPVLIAVPLPFSQATVTPQITSVKQGTDGTLQITFASQSGKFYFIQYSEDFTHWLTDPVPIKAASSTATALQNNAGGCRFYRIMLAP